MIPITQQISIHAPAREATSIGPLSLSVSHLWSNETPPRAEWVPLRENEKDNQEMPSKSLDMGIGMVGVGRGVEEDLGFILSIPGRMHLESTMIFHEDLRFGMIS